MNLVCSKCGSEEFKNSCTSTLMAGPVNYYIYTCANCGNRERVKRVDTNYNKRTIILGEADEVIKKENK